MCNLHCIALFALVLHVFALVLHILHSFLSQSESSNFFVYIISIANDMISSAIWNRSIVRLGLLLQVIVNVS